MSDAPAAFGDGDELCGPLRRSIDEFTLGQRRGVFDQAAEPVQRVDEGLVCVHGFALGVCLQGRDLAAQCVQPAGEYARHIQFAMSGLAGRGRQLRQVFIRASEFVFQFSRETIKATGQYFQLVQRQRQPVQDIASAQPRAQLPVHPFACLE